MQNPNFIYGTAWKEDRTEALTLLALENGFRAIDTANQRKHYFEVGVGQGIAKFLEKNATKREELFLQSKFTYVRGQDERLPYEKNAPIEEQVRQSFESTLKHLNSNYLDSYLLHGPEFSKGLTDNDWKVWSAFEGLLTNGKVKAVGVSNFSDDQLQLLLTQSKTKPAFVQNRCFAVMGWDFRVRNLCQKFAIKYQGFSLLTANAAALQTEDLTELSAKHDVPITRIIFRFAQQVGIIPLTGTSKAEHMASDLLASKVLLDEAELEMVETCALNAR